MKSTGRLFALIGALGVVLLGSVALNYSLYQQGRQYFLELSGTRLDPLGLSYYSSEPNQQSSAKPDLTTVVFFGDSRVADWSPPDLRQFQFINRGIGSETSVQAVHRFDYHVSPLSPDIVIVQVGINDLKTVPLFPEQKAAIVANCQSNIREIVERSTGLGARVILTTIFPTGRVPLERRLFWSDDVAVAVDEVNAFIRSLAGNDVVVLDSYSILASDGGSIQPEYSRDLLHLSAAGYWQLDKVLGPILLKLVEE